MVLGGLGRATDDSTDSTSSAQSERSLWTGVSIFVPARYTVNYYYCTMTVTVIVVTTANSCPLSLLCLT
jgi:hypothetical protein